MIQLEICAQSLTSALAAQEGGAHRIELCSALEVGGLTPSYATLIETRKQLGIEICVLIRPRAGDFFYSNLEFDLMKKDILFCKQQGVEGIVVGFLNQNRTFDLKKMEILAQLAYPIDIICHRAFDQTPDPFEALAQLQNLGYQRILTSGQSQNAVDGKEILRGLVEAAQGKIEIMPGAGVNPSNIQELINYTKATTIHTSAKAKIKSSIQDKTDGWRDNDYWETDVEIVKQLVSLI
jgi:copper homeostasis protein